jgi:AraC-like DNA-binding protein
MFGLPVIEYLYNLKMEHAKNMLYDQGMYVGEVAADVGYKNANHFATAFKRRFGMSPSRV